MGKKKDKKLRKERLNNLNSKGVETLVNVKSKCCKKYKKSEQKRCKKCPCFDLLSKVA
jgi:hypothetical protein